MNEQWERQKRELDSYNTFFAVIKGEITGEGLRDLDFRYVGRFLSIPDHRKGLEVEPDFVLYNGSTLLLVEVKSGSNIDDRTIQQMQDCDELSIEAAQEYLKDVEWTEPELDPNDLDTIQPCVVYYEEFVEECKDHQPCVEALNEVKEYAAVLTQQKGERLQLEGGRVGDEEFGDVVSDGFPLPEAPDKNVYLTEGVEPECLAFSVCLDCVVNNMGQGRLTLSPSGVRNRYQNRELPMDRVRTVLRFLDEVGACRKTDDGEYEFTQAHLSTIVSIQEKLAEKPVSEWLDEDSDDQAGLDDFM